MSIKLSHLPLRLATGAFLVSSGMTKLSISEDEAKQLQGFAAGGLPVVGQVSPGLFGRGLAITELALGGALLAPLVPAGVAGAGLGAFSGALLWLYAKTPGLHEEASLRPTPEGIPMAKDIWMAGIASSLVIDDLGSRVRRLFGGNKRQSSRSAPSRSEAR